MTSRGVVSDQRLLLRREVGAFRARESRRVFDLAVYVGRFGGGRDSITVAARDLPALDAGLRCDLVARMLEDADPGWTQAWVTRPGTVEENDLDHLWLAACRAAFATFGREPSTFHALTRSGWRDVLTGETRTWVRLRL